MLPIVRPDVKTYHPQSASLGVEKGWCHFSREGAWDFLDTMAAWEPMTGGAAFAVETFRGKRARVELCFVSDTAFRLRMLPEAGPRRENPVFDLPPWQEVTVREDGDFFLLQTPRVTLRLRKAPWELTVSLDGAEVTREQIRDHNVDQNYKALPIGFTTAPDGRVTGCFETMYLHCDEGFYGFGEKFNAFNKRGHRITVWQRDAQSTNSDVSYKAMPFFLSSQGYAVLLNTFTRTHFNMGATSGVSYTMETEDPYLDYYCFCGADPKAILASYTGLTGRSPMIPRWAFGFWMSRMSYMSREELEQIVAQMEEFGMGVDVVHIDAWQPNFQGSFLPSCTGELLEFDEARFPDPEGMIRALRQKGLRLSLWMFPYVQQTDPAGRLSRQYQLMRSRGWLVKGPDGEPRVFSPGEGDVDAWKVAALDFTNPGLVEYMKGRVRRLMDMGVGVMKTDFSEELPEDCVFFDGSTGRQSHNKYPLLYAKTIYEASAEAKAARGEKALLWGRSGYAGSQNYPANWAGDSSAARNNLHSILTGGLSMALSGISFWGFDIGGFYNCDYSGRRVVPEDEDYIRSVQMGLMSPLSRSHGQSTPREPWVYSQAAQEAFRKISALRYRLLPYLYSTAWQTTREGIPMMRPMLLEFPEDPTAWHISTQYLLGGSLLVAPVFDQRVHRVYLPQGSWIDLESGRRLAGGRWVTYEKRLDRIPLLLRPDTLLTLLPTAPRHTPQGNFRELEVVANLVRELRQDYFDDGIQGVLRARVQEGVLTIETENIPVSAYRIHTDAAVDTVTVNGQVRPFRREGSALVL